MLDLHTHTICSDGTLTPAELLELAVATELTALSITDHDTVDAYDDPALVDPPLRVIPGVELSLSWSGGNLHLLGYRIDPFSSDLRSALAELMVRRDERNRTMIAGMAAAGLPISFEQVRALAGTDYIGRPHMALALVQSGACNGIHQAFERWLADDKPFFVPRVEPDMAVGIELIHAAGGVAVLAHPYQTGLQGAPLAEAVRVWADQGLDGLEVYYSRHNARKVREYRALAERFSLCFSVGSDFHGATKPDVQLGRIPCRKPSDKSVLGQLAARRR